MSLKSALGNIIRLKNSFLAVVILVQALLIGLTLIFLQITVQLLDQAEEERIRGAVSYVNNQIDQATDRALTATLGVANNLYLAQVFSEYNREKLAVAVKPLWDDLKPIGLTQFNFYVKPKDSPDWRFFYRAHRPEQFNDPLGNRPTVLKANATRSVVKGLEQGRAGYGFRAVAPVIYKDAQIGTIETGFDFGTTFLEILNKDFPGNWGIYNLARGVAALDDRVLTNAIGPQKDKVFQNLLPNDSIMREIRAGKYTYDMDQSTGMVSLYLPVKNFQGDIVVMLKYASPTQYFTKLQQAELRAAMVCVVGLLLSSLIIYALFKMITTPVRQLVRETEKIKNFQLDEPIRIESSLGEVKELVDAMGAMKIGLQSFRKYIPDQLVRQLIQSRQEAVVSGQRKQLTIFFSDIADFSTISEQLTPNQLASQLSEYLSEMTAIISDHGGTVDKYIGDAIMAFWGAPIELKDHAHQACLAALECQRRLQTLAVKWKQEGKPVFHTRIGINSGEAVVGNIGSATRLSYTVIGDAVNLASRLEGLNKEYGTSTIISQSTLEQLPDDFAYRLVDIVVVKGRTEPVPIYELAAAKGDITSIGAEFMALFSKAVQSYVEKDWARARGRFTKLLEIRPGDRACQIFIERCNEFEATPPEDDWAGEYVYTRK